MGDTKRKMLTPEERVAKLEADLAAAKVKAEGVDRKRYEQLDEQHAKLSAKHSEISEKIDAVEAEMNAIIERVPALAEPKLTVVSNSASSDDAEAAAV